MIARLVLLAAIVSGSAMAQDGTPSVPQLRRLPPASASTMGLMRCGAGLVCDATGTVSVKPQGSGGATSETREGPPGPPGAAGPPGSTGERGPQGLPGPPGRDGRQGDVGPRGEVGPAGLAGQKGDAGPPGSAGSAGQPGPIGAQGAPGAKGDHGPQGASGPAGSQGPSGAKGDQGARGEAGPQGDPGARGRDGLSGAPGLPAVRCAIKALSALDGTFTVSIADCGLADPVVVVAVEAPAGRDHVVTLTSTSPTIVVGRVRRSRVLPILAAALAPLSGYDPFEVPGAQLTIHVTAQEASR